MMTSLPGAISIPSLDLVAPNLYGSGEFTVYPAFCTTPRLALWTDDPNGAWAYSWKRDCDYWLYATSIPPPGHVLFFNAVTFPSEMTRPGEPQHREEEGIQPGR